MEATQGHAPATPPPEQLAAREPDAVRFLAEHGRLPRIGDDIHPWHYRGWLLFYVQGAHAQIPDTGNRWGYWMRTLEAGELLDEPIPQVEFNTQAYGQSRNEPTKSIEDCMRIIENGRGSSWDSFRNFVEWLSWGLATSREKSRLDDDVQEKLYRTFDLRPWLERPGDHLGEFLQATKTAGWNPNAFFATPHSLCWAMALMIAGGSFDSPTLIAAGIVGALADGRDFRLATVCDPAVGTGRMLMAASNYSLCLYGQDVDHLVVQICLINGALYAPWMAFPMPAEMLARCNAVRHRVDDAGDELPPLILPPGRELPEAPTAYPDVAAVPDELDPEALAMTVEALARARALIEAIDEDDKSNTTMPADRRGQGLLFE